MSNAAIALCEMCRVIAGALDAGEAAHCPECNTAHARPRSVIERPPNPVSDLELLAQWAPEIEGSSNHINPSFQQPFIAPTGDKSGRSDRIDENSRFIRKAIRALMRLERLLSGPHGEDYVLALGYCFYFCGSETRKQWEKSNGLETRVGLLLASDETRAEWNSMRLVAAERAAAAWGEKLLAEATAAYRRIVSVDSTATARHGRLSIGILNDILSRFSERAEAKLRAFRVGRRSQNGRTGVKHSKRAQSGKFESR